MNNQKDIVWIPILIMVVAVAAFSAMAYLVWHKNASSTETTDLTKPPVEHVAKNSSVEQSHFLALAYKNEKNEDTYILSVLDVAMAAIVRSAALHLSGIEITESSQGAFAASDGIQFNPNDDDIVFAAGIKPATNLPESGNPPTTGLYRTSFTTPDQVGTIVRYEQKLQYISNWIYDAVNNRVVFFLVSITQPNSVSLNSVDLTTKQVREILQYDGLPYIPILHFTGSELSSFVWEHPDEYNRGKGYIDTVDLETGKKDRVAVPDAGALSPNGTILAYWSYGEHKYTLSLWNLNTQKLSSYSGIGTVKNANILWSTDGKELVIDMSDGTKLFDLASGAVRNTLSNVGDPLLWSHGTRLIYDKNNELNAYDFEKKASLVLNSGQKHSSGYFGMGWVNVSTAGWKTYTNTQYGFTIRYPGECLEYSGCYDGSRNIQFGNTMLFVADDDGATTVDDWVEDQHFIPMLMQFAPATLGGVVGIHFSLIGTKESGITLRTPGEGRGDPGFPKNAGSGYTIEPGSEGVLILRNNKVYGVVFLADSQNRDITQYSSMLSTFTFTK